MLKRVAVRAYRLLWRLLALLRIRPPRRLLPGFRGPLLSVVMPVYNVEAYVAEAVESVLGQSYRNLELIVIDDGSLDGSTAIVRRYARRDFRVRYVRTPNGGLATARNRGAERARGTYLTFVDSDDVVPRRAYETMVRSLEASGSDLATGNVVRIREGHAARPSWNQRASHDHTLVGTTMKQHPLLVRDTTAWNKVFRRSFFEEQDLVFPPGKLYEDMVPITRALARARAIDVISDVCYRWRIRDEANSITQRRFEIPNITDKVDMLYGCLEQIEHDPELYEAMLVKIFEADLWTYAPHVGVGDTAFDEQFDRAMSGMWRDEFLGRMKLRTIVKLVFYATYHYLGARAAQEALGWGSAPWQTLPTESSDGEVYVQRPTSPDLSGVPREAFSLTHLIDVQPRVTDVRWVDGRLRVRGWAYLPQVCDAPEQEVELVLVGPGDRRQPLEVARRPEPLVEAASRSPFYDMLESGFEVLVDPAQLADGVWTLEVTARARGIERTRVVDDVLQSGTGRTVAGSLVGGRVVRVLAQRRRPFGVDIGRPDVVVTAVEPGGSEVAVTLEAPEPVVAVWAENADGRDRVEARGVVADRRVRAVLAPPPLATGAARQRTLRVRLASGRTATPFVDASVADPLPVCSVVAAPGTGDAQLQHAPRVLAVDDLEVTDGPLLRLAGAGPAGARGTVLVEDQHGVAHDQVPVVVGRDGRFTAALALRTPGGDGVERVLPANKYLVRATLDGTEQTVRLRALAASGRLPMQVDVPQARVLVELAAEGQLQVRPFAPAKAGERGARAQHVLAERWWGSAGPSPVGDSVFIGSFTGRSVGCHPAAIGHELRRRGFEGPVYAEVADGSVPVPETFTPVVHRSEDWYRAIGTSRWVVNNTAFPVDVTIGDDQTYLQTWHGTPLKRIGRDILRVLMSRAWLDRADREARDQWTHLLSPSPYTTEIFPRALGFDGPVLELGSPRLDALVRDPDYARRRVHDLLGIPAGRTVVLYTPTWRDDGRVSELLDVQEFVRRLRGRATLLVRAHPNVVGLTQKRNVGVAEGDEVVVHDVSRYPVVEDLYSAADVMVTDYSSTMFDFAATGRPQVVFAPDIAVYRDEVRGFYVDFDEWAPGPFAQSSDHVIDLVSDVPGLTAAHADRRARFVERFLPLEDGGAAGRVIDALGIGQD
ncbi:MAG: CDP-glycerol glycerophosphotransferase family protein [Aeromicrobium erythreum]